MKYDNFNKDICATVVQVGYGVFQFNSTNFIASLFSILMIFGMITTHLIVAKKYHFILKKCFLE